MYPVTPLPDDTIGSRPAVSEKVPNVMVPPATGALVVVAGVVALVRDPDRPDAVGDRGGHYPHTQQDEIDSAVDARRMQRFDEVMRDESALVGHASAPAQQSRLERRQRAITAGEVDGDRGCNSGNVRGTNSYEAP